MNTNTYTYGLEDLEQIADKILQYMGDTRLLLLRGKLGAGKTTLTTAICHKLGYNDEVSSPTYSLINEYQGEELIYHMDLYRLKEMDEAYDIGIEDYLYSGKLCIIEWPDIIGPILDQLPYVLCDIEQNELGRKISLSREDDA